MSRRNYIHNIHSMDSLIGKPFYSNAIGRMIDPNTGMEAETPMYAESLEDHINPYRVPLAGLMPTGIIAEEEIRRGATPEISQAQIDESIIARSKFNEEMGKRVAEKEAMLKAEAEEELRTREARNQYAIEQNRLTDLKIAQDKADKEAKIEAEYQAGIKAQKIEADRIAEAQKQAEAKKQAETTTTTATTTGTAVTPPAPYKAPPLVVSGGSGGGGSGSSGGGGGATATKPKEPTKVATTTTSSKPSFIKKNFIPLLFVAGAIFIFIKKPIK